jgi:hypothetical protein
MTERHRRNPHSAYWTATAKSCARPSCRAIRDYRTLYRRHRACHRADRFGIGLYRCLAVCRAAAVWLAGDLRRCAGRARGAASWFSQKERSQRWARHCRSDARQQVPAGLGQVAGGAATRPLADGAPDHAIAAGRHREHDPRSAPSGGYRADIKLLRLAQRTAESTGGKGNFECRHLTTVHHRIAASVSVISRLNCTPLLFC